MAGIEPTGRVVVVAIGGNSLITDPGHTGLEDQARTVRQAMAQVAEIVADGWNAVVTHGNGPQVGFLLRRSELAAPELPLIPLDVLVADTQGATGYLLSRALDNELNRRGLRRASAAIVTRTVVALDDQAFAHPAKPIGSFMTEAEARQRMAEGWKVAEDSGRGWRRLVPSPAPRRIVEIDAIRSLIDAGFVVVAAGGGGIPVVEADTGYEGVEAVIDKDHSTALLASQLGASLLLISTGVDGAAVGFGTASERWLAKAHVHEMRHYLAAGEFATGSMEPKVEAAIDFVERGGSAAVITSPARLAEALRGGAGTWIVA
jgi:carbamate kinase